MMSNDNNQEDIDVDADVEPTISESDTHTKPLRRPFSKLATELTDDELGSPGVQKMLLAEVSRLEAEIVESARFKEKFYEADRERAILKEKVKASIYLEILYSISLTLGALLIGFTSSINSTQDSAITIGVIGALFILGAILAKIKTFREKK